jgi:ATP/ADP translocase
MVREYLIEVLFMVTVISGLIAVLAVAGWLWGAEDAKLVLLLSGAVFLPCSIIVSFMKDGWKRILAELIPF